MPRNIGYETHHKKLLFLQQQRYKSIKQHMLKSLRFIALRSAVATDNIQDQN